MDIQKSRIHSEFVHQKNLLAKEEQRQLQKLEKDEREHLRVLGEKEIELAEKNQALQELITELERRSRGSNLELLQVRPHPTPAPAPAPGVARSIWNHSKSKCHLNLWDTLKYLNRVPRSGFHFRRKCSV